MKTLIVITTASRDLAIKSFIWDYVKFIKDNDNYELLISLDGKDKKTIDYCKKYNLPLLYSEEQEGVGLSKNRVLAHYPMFDYYFFIEDDVELLNSNIFNIYIDLSNKLNLYHMSLFDESRIIEKKSITEIDNFKIIHSMYGSAQVNFFTKFAIEKVGGFHTEFAKYKRFGHTEHTYRFVNNGLTEYPFNIVENCLYGYFKWHEPLSVTKVKVKNNNKNRLSDIENELLTKKIKYFPITTLSNYQVINEGKQIIFDKLSFLYRIKFLFVLNILDTLRSIKKLW